MFKINKLRNVNTKFGKKKKRMHTSTRKLTKKNRKNIRKKILCFDI